MVVKGRWGDRVREEGEGGRGGEGVKERNEGEEGQ